MKKSLKEQLNNLIRIRGEISHAEIQRMCEDRSFGKIYRISNAERRLWPSESPDIKAVKFLKGNAVEKYVWIGTPIKYQTYKVEGLNKIIKLPI